MYCSSGLHLLNLNEYRSASLSSKRVLTVLPTIVDRLSFNIPFNNPLNRFAEIFGVVFRRESGGGLSIFVFEFYVQTAGTRGSEIDLQLRAIESQRVVSSVPPLHPADTETNPSRLKV